MRSQQIENLRTVIVKTWGKVKVTHCKSEENLAQRDRTVTMEIEFVEKVEDENDRLNTDMAHAIVGDVVVQLGHRYLCLRRILLQFGPKRKI